jgi:hypothetical protein
MVGTFSSQDVGHRSVGVEPVTQYEFRDDGSLVATAMLTCPSTEETPIDEYEWTSSEDDVTRRCHRAATADQEMRSVDRARPSTACGADARDNSDWIVATFPNSCR